MICYCCGSSSFTSNNVLSQELINQWRISNYEAEYINKQQGNKCTKCHSNFRSIALAFAIMKSFDYVGLFKDFVKEERIQNLRILEINEAGNLTHFLQQIPNHTLSIYPESDMMNMKFPDMSFDLVIHSDVLEHIKYPIRGLSECYRILKPGGYCAFTIPIIVDRLTISREGMPPSYHGSSDNPSDDLIVHTEYGCDSWRQVIQAGFQQCRLFSIDYPSSLALVAVKDKIQTPVESLYIDKSDDLLKVFEINLYKTQEMLQYSQSQLHQTQIELERSQNMIKAMESSKFWKIRQFWFTLKQIFRTGH